MNCKHQWQVGKMLAHKGEVWGTFVCICGKYKTILLTNEVTE